MLEVSMRPVNTSKGIGTVQECKPIGLATLA